MPKTSENKQIFEAPANQDHCFYFPICTIMITQFGHELYVKLIFSSAMGNMKYRP
jgi:hypothetical protein